MTFLEQTSFRSIVLMMFVVAIVFFPMTNQKIERMMHWWWFRLAWLMLLVLITVAYHDSQTALLGALLFVMASNVSNVRFVSTSTQR